MVSLVGAALERRARFHFLLRKVAFIVEFIQLGFVVGAVVVVVVAVAAGKCMQIVANTRRRRRASNER